MHNNYVICITTASMTRLLTKG